MIELKEEWIKNLASRLQICFSRSDAIYLLVNEALDETYEENEEIHSQLSYGEYHNLMSKGGAFYVHADLIGLEYYLNIKLKKKWLTFDVKR